MKKLWRKIKAHFSGWPESANEENKIKEETKESQARKEKKPKGLKPKKKKVKKQGNMK